MLVYFVDRNSLAFVHFGVSLVDGFLRDASRCLELILPSSDTCMNYPAHKSVMSLLDANLSM